MSGVAIILALLNANSDLLAKVPAARIMGDDLPIGIALPAMSVTLISSVDTPELAPASGGKRYVRDRVQVTVFAATAPERYAAIQAVRKACADQLYPTISPWTGITVHTESQGPDFTSDDGNIRIGTQDFRVRYNEDR